MKFIKLLMQHLRNLKPSSNKIYILAYCFLMLCTFHFASSNKRTKKIPRTK